jgi:hypothetical protein
VNGGLPSICRRISLGQVGESGPKGNPSLGSRFSICPAGGAAVARKVEQFDFDFVRP